MDPHSPHHPLSRDPARERPADLEGPCLPARDAARLGLYVHVPFCVTSCTYCDFSSGRLSAAAVERYLAGMERECELRAASAAGLTFTSVFFGGGTPSALAPRHFHRLWSALSHHFHLAADAEITLEANPESVRPALLAAWVSAGINRLSMGAQSFNPEELTRLGRIHSVARPAEAFALARAAGFERLSLDLMFGYPGHDSMAWGRTLEVALELEPEHLSAYCFIPESGTPLGNAVIAGDAQLPDAGAQTDLYAQLTERLAAAGHGCYETSNFCLPGAEARHNLVYWLRRPYLALGPSAHGFLDGERYGNHYAMLRWAAALERGQSPEVEREHESKESVAEETVMLGLRLASGLHARDYPAPAWENIKARMGTALERARATGRVIGGEEEWRIPSNLRFVADDVIAWITAEADRTAFDSERVGSVTSVSCPSHPFQAA
jgi:oxygen-independent coproporphyrinogen III oxidase